MTSAKLQAARRELAALQAAGGVIGLTPSAARSRFGALMDFAKASMPSASQVDAANAETRRSLDRLRAGAKPSQSPGWTRKRMQAALAEHRRMSDRELRMVATHEAGHAVVARATGGGAKWLDIAARDERAGTAYIVVGRDPVSKVAAALAGEIATGRGDASPEDWQIVHDSGASKEDIEAGRRLAASILARQSKALDALSDELQRHCLLDQNDIEIILASNWAK